MATLIAPCLYTKFRKLKESIDNIFDEFMTLHLCNIKQICDFFFIHARVLYKRSIEAED